MSSTPTRRLVSVRKISDVLDCTPRTVERKHQFDPHFPRFVKQGRKNFVFDDELQEYVANLPEKPRKHA